MYASWSFCCLELTQQVENLRNINLRKVLIKIHMTALILVNQLKAILLSLKLIFIVVGTRVHG